MTDVQRKQVISQALQSFGGARLRDNATALLGALGYASERKIDLSQNTARAFRAHFDPEGRLNGHHALIEDWKSIDLLFQLTDEEVGSASQGRLGFSKGQVDNTVIESYLFFAVDLSGTSYTRTKLAAITREINKLFPMPVMLLFRYGSTLTIAIINREIHKHDENRENALRDIELRIEDIERSFNTKFHELDFARKLYLIENSIYGVDIQPIACQIAKLRFFIALIVDQRVDRTVKNSGVRPLPNLETRIVAADVLTPVEKIEQHQYVLGADQVKKLRESLALVRHEHFNARTPEKKAKCRARDSEIRAELAEELEMLGMPNYSALMLASWDPYDQNVHATFFDSDWMFSVKAGFDIVIGNPPYVRIQTLKQIDPEYAIRLKSEYASASKGNFDLYVVFVERALQLLTPKGNVAYILPHKFFNAQYGAPLRALILALTRVALVTLVTAVHFNYVAVMVAGLIPALGVVGVGEYSSEPLHYASSAVTFRKTHHNSPLPLDLRILASTAAIRSPQSDSEVHGALLHCPFFVPTVRHP